MPLKYPFDPRTWQPPKCWRRILTVDAHAEGEPLRVILAGFPDLPGETVRARSRLAIHHTRGEIGVGEPIVVESILGTRFTGRILHETVVGRRGAVVPEVAGRSSITGRHEFLLDPDDPLRHGFLVR